MNSGQIKIPGGADGSPEEKQASLPQRPSSTDTERPPSGQHEQPHMKAERSDDDEQDLDVDPAEKIALFDWQNLTQRYHDEMTKCQQNEEELMKEWEELMNFFRIWAEAGHAQETDRTYHRLRTRMAHVQHSEENLEKKRLHYIKVVEAFQSALSLLQGNVS